MVIAKQYKKDSCLLCKKIPYLHPSRIEKELNIIVKIDNLRDYSGCYIYIKRHKYIFINNNLNEHEQLLVMAHELGHAILHSRTNCYFMRNKTYLLCNRIEKETNYYQLGDLPLVASLEDIKQWLSYKCKLNYLKIAGYLLMFIGLSINYIAIYERIHSKNKEK